MDDYTEINASLAVFYKWARRGMIVGQIKEKYYTTRWYANLNSNFSLNDVFYPCHYYVRIPWWLHRISSKVFKYTGVSWLIFKWRVYCYKQAYKEVLSKYPKVRHCINFVELLK